jgi:spermidine synthase
MIVRAKKLVSYFYPIRLVKDKGEFVPYLEVVMNRGKYEMNGEKVNYSYGSLYTVFDNAFENFKLQNKSIDSALIFGFGAGSVADLIAHKINPACKITGIENDGTILANADAFFDLGKFKNLNLIKQDAFTYAADCHDKFDLIVVDLFVENRVPVHAKQLEFLLVLKSILNENGIVFFNKITNTKELKQEGLKLLDNMQKTFGSIQHHKEIVNGIENSVFVYI